MARERLNDHITLIKFLLKYGKCNDLFLIFQTLILFILYLWGDVVKMTF